MVESVIGVPARDQERQRLVRALERRLEGRLRLLREQANAYRAAQRLSSVQAGQAIAVLSRMADQLWNEYRDLSAELWSDGLDKAGLLSALESLSLRIERRYGIPVQLDLPAPPVALLLPSGEMAHVLYCVAREALDNAGIHAQAGRMGLCLRVVTDQIHLTIADDGVGFRPPNPLTRLASQGRWGLVAMVERIEAVRGELQVSSVPGIGTQIRVQVPVGSRPAAVTSEQAVPAVEPLTSREQQVLAGIAAGLTNKQIAAQLGISDRTVQFHVSNVLGKLGAASRTEAAVRALESGLL
jgi:signal transduction histidine kinase/DNA-binding CsgD family transcriptional regulator